jgi:hypothetical protein
MASPRSLAANPIPDWKWSPREKAVARKAFDLALGRELESAIQETKDRAARIVKTSDLWELESWLSKRRREIDRTFDFRYSVLPLVFASLLRNGQLGEEELHGLALEKLESIRYIARR